MKYFRLNLNLFLLFTISLSFVPISLLGQGRGSLVEDSLYFRLDFQEIDSLYGLLGLPPALAPIEYELDVYRLVYRTKAATGDSLTTASGLVFIPVDNCGWPVISYQHGTNFYGAAPSDLGLEWLLGIPFSTAGYVVSMSDYLGLGVNPSGLPHPFLHADTEASASIDMLRAVRAFCNRENIGLTEQLFLGGYSQGGHATLATQRSMERDFPSEFQVTATSAGGGPYNLEQTLVDLAGQDEGDNAFFLAYAMMGFQFVYGNLWTDPVEAFQPPYDSLIPAYFNPLDPQPVALPDTARNIINPSYLSAVLQDSLHPVRVALRDNNLIHWTPQAQMRLYYCQADLTVPFQNSIQAADTFISRGANMVDTLNAGAELGHEECAIPVIFGTKFWFDALKDSCVIDTGTVSHIVSGSKPLVKAFPQPAYDQLFLELDPVIFAKGWTQVRIRSLLGEKLFESKLDFNHGNAIDVTALASGTYILEIWSERTFIRQKLLIN